MKKRKNLIILILCVACVSLVMSAMRYPALSISGVKPGMSMSTVKSILGQPFTGVLPEVRHQEYQTSEYFGHPPRWEIGAHQQVFRIQDSDVDPPIDHYIWIAYDESKEVKFVCSDHLSAGSSILGPESSGDEIRSVLGEEVGGLEENGSWCDYKPGVTVRYGWTDGSRFRGIPRSYFLRG